MGTSIFMLLCAVCQFSVLVAHRDHPVPTYFRRVDKDGKLVDRRSESYRNNIPQQFNNRISRLDATTAVLKVSPSEVSNADKVNVSWAGVTDPQAKDFIAFYCPTTDDATHYLDYFWVTDASTWSEGYGTREIVIYNMRATCQFRYYRNNNYTQLVASSNEVSFKDGGDAAPLHGHIASTGNPSEMRVMWVSGLVDSPLVRYGLTKQLNMVQRNGVSRTYNASMMCEGPAADEGFWRPGYMHDFVLQNLTVNTRYYYSFGTDEYMSPIYNFTSDIPAGDSTPFTWIVYGDMGVAAYPQAVGTENLMLKEIAENNARLVFHDGDISYARGHAYIWDQWFSLIQPFATLVPYMVTIGNHEQDHENGGEHDPSGDSGQGFHPKWGNYGQDSGGECGVPMYYRFTMPDNGHKIWWYSWDYGLVHFVAMSTEHNFTEGSAQYLWLERDLMNVNRSRTPWVVIAGHRAMYCSQISVGDFVVGEEMQRSLEDMFYKYRVDLAIWGHYHLYERTCKLYKQTCVEDGILHVTVGSAGFGLDEDNWFDRPWSKFHAIDYGYGRVTVFNSTHMKYEWIENRSGNVVDFTWLEK